MSSAAPHASAAARGATVPVVLAPVLAALAGGVAASVALGGVGALPVVRAVVLALLTCAVGLTLGTTLVAARLPLGSPSRGRLLDAGAVAAGAQTVLAAGTAFLLYLGTAPAPSDPAFGPGLVAFVADVPIGRTWAVAAAAAAVLTAVLLAVRSRAGVVALWPLVALSAVPLALPGALGGEALGIARALGTATFVQLLAVGTWIGMAALATLGAGPRGRGVPLACTSALLVSAATVWTRPSDAPAPLAVAAGAVVLLAALAALGGRAALQLLLLAVGIGLGAASSVSATAPQVPQRTTPAEILTGAPLPPPPSPTALLGTWQPDPLWLVVAVGLLAAYLVALRGTSAAWPARRTASWVAGLVVLVWLTSGGPAEYQEVVIGAHLAQHVAMLLVVPLLLAGGAPLRLVAASLPGARLPAPRPVAAALLAVVLVAVTVGTQALRWSLTDPIGTEAVLAADLLAGAWLVRSTAAPEVRRAAAVTAVGVLLGLELLGAVLLATSPSLLLADWYGAMGWGTDALAAQRGAWAALLPVAAVPTLVLLLRAIRPPATPSPLRREAVAA